MGVDVAVLVAVAVGVRVDSGGYGPSVDVGEGAIGVLVGVGVAGGGYGMSADVAEGGTGVFVDVSVGVLAGVGVVKVAEVVNETGVTAAKAPLSNVAIPAAPSIRSVIATVDLMSTFLFSILCLLLSLRQSRGPLLVQEAALGYDPPSPAPGPFRSRCWDYWSRDSVIPL